MRRSDFVKPGPKSKRWRSEAKRSKIKSLLGDGSSTEQSSTGEEFMSADLNSQTDYGLNFTSSRINSPGGSRQEGNVDSLSQRMADQRREIAVASRKTGHNDSSRRTPRKQPTPHRRRQKLLKDIAKLQARTDNLIPKAPFSRLVREILATESTIADRVTATALLALQESSEMYLTALFQDAYCCTLHRGRVTLNVKDIELTRFLRGRLDPGNL